MARLPLALSILLIFAPGLAPAKGLRKIASVCMSEYDTCSMQCAKIVQSCYKDGKGCKSKKIIACVKRCEKNTDKTCKNSNLESVSDTMMSPAALKGLAEAIEGYSEDNPDYQ